MRVTTHEVPYVRQPVDFSIPVRYLHGPDSSPQPGVPRGAVVNFEYNESEVYPGTSRTVWVHVPARYDPSKPAALMVFQDGALYLDPTGEMRAGIVLDNLVHRGEMPVTLGVFVDPGQPGNRNVEYDAFDDRHATFLLTEIVPEVENRFAVTGDPDQWAICGGSSGGNCALTVAWHRPDRFRRVVSFLGSFAQMPGGNPYPAAIRDEPAKPLRIFMQAGTRDLNWNEPQLNWFSNNLKVAAALAEAGYDHRLVLGDGGHSPNHGGVLLPDALRWIWRADTTDES
jgi:enterochelin esterase family protein